MMKIFELFLLVLVLCSFIAIVVFKAFVWATFYHHNHTAETNTLREFALTLTTSRESELVKRTSNNWFYAIQREEKQHVTFIECFESSIFRVPLNL
jgi:hypothetical protein